MNIFATDPDPVLAARALDDKRVVKMALETAQLLSVACRFTYPLANDHLYKISHYNHPCAVWARADLHNFLWLYDHGVALCNEYQFRYERRHRSLDVIELAFEHVKTFGDMFPGTQSSVEFTFNSSGFDTGDVFEDYRLCLVRKWLTLDSRRPRWTYRNKPVWFDETSTKFNLLQEGVISDHG